MFIVKSNSSLQLPQLHSLLPSAYERHPGCIDVLEFRKRCCVQGSDFIILHWREDSLGFNRTIIGPSKMRKFVVQDMFVSEEFQANIEALPNILQRKYALLWDLDKSLQEIQRQNEQRCQQEIDDMKRSIKSGSITPNSSLLKFSDDALDEQKHAIRIADEKVALAVQAYDLVDTHIQHLDRYLKKVDEDLRRERDIMATTGSPSTLGNNMKAGRDGETSNKGRKRTRRGTASASASATASAPIVANSTSMELDLPVDPNEPTYCFCNQVSFGEMVACDNPDCKIEWFHYSCVGLKEQPKGKWYCSQCVGTQRRRKTR